MSCGTNASGKYVWAWGQCKCHTGASHRRRGNTVSFGVWLLWNCNYSGAQKEWIVGLIHHIDLRHTHIHLTLLEQPKSHGSSLVGSTAEPFASLLLFCKPFSPLADEVNLSSSFLMVNPRGRVSFYIKIAQCLDWWLGSCSLQIGSQQLVGGPDNMGIYPQKSYIESCQGGKEEKRMGLI